MNAARKKRGRGSLSCALVAALLIAITGCQDSTLPAASRPTADSVQSTAPSDKPPTADSLQPTQPAAPATRPQPIRDISFDAVKLNMKKEDPFKRSLLTPAIEKLDGARIRIRGYILPPFQQSGLIRFVLVRDNMACCFGPGAAIYDSMIVQLQPGLTTDYTVSPVTVEGTFNIREVEGPGGNCISIYHLTAETVK